MALVDVLRYAYLAQRFDGDMWKALLSDCPVEANSITRPWSPSDYVDVLETDHQDLA